MRKKEQGRSMIETLAFLALVGLIITITFGAYKVANRRALEGRTQLLVAQLIDDIRMAYETRRALNANDLTPQRLFERGAIPRVLCSTDDCATLNRHPLGGEIRIALLAALPTDPNPNPNLNRRFTVTIDGLSRASCISLARFPWVQGMQERAIFQIRLNDRFDILAARQAISGQAGRLPPAFVAAINDNCGNAGNSLEFRVNK